MEGRISHELTHGIRTRIVVDSLYPNDVNARQFSMTTPKKSVNHRMRKFRGLSGMENASFHSGYWMEQELYRVAVIVLLGDYDVGRLVIQTP
jgi:hypothetical protein